MDDKYKSVSSLNMYIKNKIDSDFILQNCYIKGEIANFRPNQTGHLYFTVKDDNSKIKAVMFKASSTKLKFELKDGMQVLLKARVSVYDKSGEYQLYVDEMELDGIGNLYLQYEELKLKLSKEGLFDRDHKLTKPRIPFRIGVVTASTGAAIQDIFSTINKRFPPCEVILYPCLVQGEAAAKSISEQIDKASNSNLDLLIIGRGGGSILDLWAFNEEIVARSIYECKIPTISCVGHEIDYTICDYVCDYRAATPTSAGIMAVPDILEINKYLANTEVRLKNSIYNIYKVNSIKLDNIKESYILKNPRILVENKIINLDKLNNSLNISMDHLIQYKRNKLDTLVNSYIMINPSKLYEPFINTLDKLNDRLSNNIKNIVDRNNNKLKLLVEKAIILNPMESINRGYSIVKLNDKVISSINSVSSGDEVIINVKDGNINAKVIDINGGLDG